MDRPKEIDQKAHAEQARRTILAEWVTFFWRWRKHPSDGYCACLLEPGLCIPFDALWKEIVNTVANEENCIQNVHQMNVFFIRKRRLFDGNCKPGLGQACPMCHGWPIEEEEEALREVRKRC